MGEAVALWEGERPLPRHPPPRTCAPSICSKTPAIFPSSPLEVPWTDSHPRVTGIPLTALPFTTPQIQTSALMWRLPTGLIETRPSGSQPPSVSPNGDWLLLHPHGVPLIRTSLLPWWSPKASRFSPACPPLYLLASSWAWKRGGEHLVSLQGPVRGLASRLSLPRGHRPPG